MLGHNINIAKEHVHPNDWKSLGRDTLQFVF